jgi:hypothetical protein
MKKLTILLSTLCIPAVAWVHNPGYAMISWGIVLFLALIISLILLKRFSKSIVIYNKITRFIVLFTVEIVLFCLLTVVFMLTLGDFLYSYVFGR